MTYLLLEFVLELNELVKELDVDVLYALDALVVNLLLQVFFGHFLT